MQASLGKFGHETVLFVKPDDAIELVKIAKLLGVDLKVLEPKAPKIGGGRPTGRVLEAKTNQICFYCERGYPVKINRKSAWRHNCGDKKCRSKYSRDRFLYKNGRMDEMHKQQLMRNISEATGFKVSHFRRK